MILTSLVYLFLIVYVGGQGLVRFVAATASSWSALIGILVGLSVTLFALFVHSLSTDFGGWLISHQADGVFKSAFIYTLCVNVATFTALVIAGYSKHSSASYVALGFLIYALTNFISTVKNVSDLLKLEKAFRLNKNQQNRADVQ